MMKPAATAPRNTFELLGTLLKRLPGQFAKSVGRNLGIGLLIFVAHGVLLVGPNGGFDSSSWMGRNILNVSGGFFNNMVLYAMGGFDSGYWDSRSVLDFTGGLSNTMLLYILVGAMLPRVVAVLRSGRAAAKLQTLFTLPGKLSADHAGTKGRFLPHLLFACGGTMLFFVFITDITAVFLGFTVMGSAVAVYSGDASLLATLCRYASQDIARKRGKPNPDISAALPMCLAGCGLSLTLFGLLGLLGVGRWILGKVWIAILIVAIVTMTSKNNRPPRSMVFLFAVLGTAAVVGELAPLTVFADDGGWSEAGSNLFEWLDSEGAGRAVLMGVPPGLAGMLGSLFGGIPFEGLSDLWPLAEPEVSAEPMDAAPGEVFFTLDDPGGLGGPEDQPFTPFDENMTCGL